MIFRRNPVHGGLVDIAEPYYLVIIGILQMPMNVDSSAHAKTHDGNCMSAHMIFSFRMILNPENVSCKYVNSALPRHAVRIQGGHGRTDTRFTVQGPV